MLVQLKWLLLLFPLRPREDALKQVAWKVHSGIVHKLGFSINQKLI